MDWIRNIVFLDVLPFVVTGILTFVAAQLRTIIKSYKNDKEEHAQVKQTLIVLLKDRLYQACKYHLSKGYCTTSDREIVEFMYSDYHDDYNQNGIVEKLYHEVMALPYEKERDNE